MEKPVNAAPSTADFASVNQSASQQPLVLSYLDLRKAVGIIGFALPFVLALGKICLQGGGIESSISCYYYTDMRNVFVGSMWAIGMFLFSCKGYDHKDEIAGRLACAFAIIVALFPTSDCPRVLQRKFISTLHWVSAALLFLTLAYFCLALFTKTSSQGHPTRQKLQRNVVYRVCGYTILVSILLIGVVNLPVFASKVAPLCPVFWFESVAIVAFGFAWLTKGETILKDQES